jgi:hypothetical protein
VNERVWKWLALAGGAVSLTGLALALLNPTFGEPDLPKDRSPSSVPLKQYMDAWARPTPGLWMPIRVLAETDTVRPICWSRGTHEGLLWVNGLQTQHVNTERTGLGTMPRTEMKGVGDRRGFEQRLGCGRGFSGRVGREE